MAEGKEAVQRLVDAANVRDWEALLGACAPDVSLIHPLSALPYRGRDGVREFFVTSVDAFPDQYLHVDATVRRRRGSGAGRAHHRLGGRRAVGDALRLLFHAARRG